MEQSKIKEIKGDRALIKRKITIEISKIDRIISENGSRREILKSIGLIEVFLKEVDEVNRKLFGLLEEVEHDNIIDWYAQIHENVDTCRARFTAYKKSKSAKSSCTSVTTKTASSVSEIPQPSHIVPQPTPQKNPLLPKGSLCEQNGRVRSWVDSTSQQSIIEREQLEFVDHQSDVDKNTINPKLIDNTYDLACKRNAKSFTFFDKSQIEPTVTTQFRNSLPKLTVTKFDGDPLNWVDWAGMFCAVIDRVPMNNCEKMAHLQQNVEGKAKAAIAGFGYNGALYKEALKTLERRFGDSRLVVNAHLERLRRFYPMQDATPGSVRSLTTLLNNLVCTFQHLNYNDDLRATSNVKLAVEKITQPLQLKWNEYLVSNGLLCPSLVTFRDWIQTCAEAYDLLPSTSTNNKVQRKPTSTGTSSNQQHVNAASSSKSCVFCKQNHDITTCMSFIATSPTERAQYVKQNNLCFNCLCAQHISKNCPQPKHCKSDGCKGKHHSLIHNAEKVFQRKVTESGQHCTVTSIALNNVLLQVSPVIVQGESQSFITYALLDMASTCSLVLESLTQKLDIHGSHEVLHLNGINRRIEMQSANVNLRLKPIGEQDVTYPVNAWTVENLNLPVQRVKFDEANKQKWPHLSDLQLPNVDSSKIEILLGADNFDLIVPREVRFGPPKSPRAVKTSLGWIPTGPIQQSIVENSFSTYHVHVSTPDEQLYEHVKTWWETESFGTKFDIKSPTSAEEIRATEILEQTTVYKDGRYEVGLLWKDQAVALPSNKVQAEAMFIRQEKRLKRQPEIKRVYAENFDNDLQKGYAKILSENELCEPTEQEWYLPHHPVINPKKPGKVRRVYNAAVVHNNNCLNNNLMKGPDLLNSLVGVLMKFRERRIGISGDIEAMFSQVSVPKSDQSVLRFLWRLRDDAPIVTGQFTRHIFGATCSPTCCNYALKRTASDNAVQYPELKDIVHDNFYMDDLFYSTESEEDAIKKWKDLVNMLKLGGFHLTKASSNSRTFLNALLPAELSPAFKSLNLDSDPLPTERSLGMRWNAEKDLFIFDCLPDDKTDGILTHRTFLSLVSSVYDPIGFLGPFVIRGKLILQDIWKASRAWDTVIIGEILEKALTWLSEIKELSSVTVPRLYRQIPSCPVDIELHIFSDASEMAFASVAFFRFSFQNETVKIAFVMGKTRVAPLKRLSIPKLELQGAVLSVRLVQLIVKQHSLPISNVIFWSDSSTVLLWLRSSERKQPIFIANRVAEILEHFPSDSWRYVPSADNPADLGTRGLSAISFQSSSWLQGPDFLKQPPAFWPKNIVNKTEVETVFVCEALSTAQPMLVLKDFSSFHKLLRVTSWVFRFIDKLKKITFTDCDLSVQEIRKAEICWIKESQRIYLKEIECLRNNRVIDFSSKIASLCPCLDSNEIIRVPGRLKNAKTTAPILLPQDDLAKLILHHYHDKMHHAGTEHVRNIVQQEFWIPSSRSMLRKIKFNCIVCRKMFATPLAPQMSNLPEVRLNVAPPFSKVGLDYFGPVEVKQNRKTFKRYGCIFTCLLIRAVHVEIAFALDTDSFLLALRRFIARRGCPSEIWSDNGRNFVGGEKELKDNLNTWNQQQIKSFMLQNSIEWKFIPPYAPHFGGVWERMVQSVKRSMRAILNGQVSITDEVLLTVVLEAEALVNSRPLTSVSTDVDDLQALTPNHFLIGRANQCLPPGVFLANDITCRKRWRQAQALTNSFWQRWLTEYLPTLRPRSKWHKINRCFTEGDLVLVIEPDTPRGSWLLGRVVEAIRSSDGLVRSAKIKTAHGIIHRPSVKIILLQEQL